MNQIKLDLSVIDNQHIELDLGGNKAFSSAFTLGFALGCKNPATGRFATNETGLHKIKDGLNYTVLESLWSLSGIGALIRSANPADLVQEDLQNIGTAIDNLARLGIEAKDYIEEIDLDLDGRRLENKQLSAKPMKGSDLIVNDLIKTALACGKLIPSQRAWAERLGKTDLLALVAFLEGAR